MVLPGERSPQAEGQCNRRLSRRIEKVELIKYEHEHHPDYTICAIASFVGLMIPLANALVAASCNALRPVLSSQKAVSPTVSES